MKMNTKVITLLNLMLLFGAQLAFAAEVPSNAARGANRRKHVHGKRYQCKECGIAFYLQENLEKHSKTHAVAVPVDAPVLPIALPGFVDSTRYWQIKGLMIPEPKPIKKRKADEMVVPVAPGPVDAPVLPLELPDFLAIQQQAYDPGEDPYLSWSDSDEE